MLKKFFDCRPRILQFNAIFIKQVLFSMNFGDSYSTASANRRNGHLNKEQKGNARAERPCSEVKRCRGRRCRVELLRDARCQKSQWKGWMTYGANKTGRRGFLNSQMSLNIGWMGAGKPSKQRQENIVSVLGTLQKSRYCITNLSVSYLH